MDPILIGGKGKVSQVTDPEKLAELEAAQESIEITQAAQEAQADDILALLAPEPESLVVQREIEVKGQKRVIHVKKMGYSDCARIDAKKYRKGRNGQITRDVAFEETNGMAWQIHTCIVKNSNEGKVNSDGSNPLPDWLPLFSLEQIYGKDGRGGLMGNPDAKMFLYALSEAIWDVNPELSPILAAQAANQLGME